MSNDVHDNDEALFSGFDSLVPPLAASQRAVEQTRQLLLAPNVQRPSRVRPVVACFAAAAVSVFVLAVIFLGSPVPGDKADPTKDVAQHQNSQAHIAGSDSINPDGPPRGERKEIYQTAAFIVPHMHALSAEGAPVIVANGGKEPIRLGSTTREGGGFLHVWDWSKSPVSRVLPDVEFWGTERVALSPDGKLLVWARGEILKLETGEKTRIDLGGADVKIAESTYGRIGDMQFSPDGGCLAILVTNLDEEVPGRITSQVVQIVEFPTGRVLCEFPPGEQYALRIGFSADGRQVASADTDRQVMLRDSESGDILQRFLPALTSQVMGVAISPDGKHVAATQREPGDVFLWEADSGRLTHRIDGEDLRKHGAYSPFYGVLRFSPDGKYLAAELGRLVVFDVTKGESLVTLSVFTPANVQWSADGERLTVVSPVMAGRDWTTGDQTLGVREDRYPAIEIWDWRNRKKVPPREASGRR
jgi:WD40 repeat protein